MPSAIRRAALSLWSQAYFLCEAEHGFCRHLPQFLSRHLPDWPVAETVALDVGASVGVYAQAFSAWATRTVALEPNRSLVPHLRKLALPGTEVIPAAAGAEAGEALLVDDGTGRRRPEARLGKGGAWSQPCPVVPLDRVAEASRAVVCKIDVEGTEAAVLDGMSQLLSLDHILLIVEIEARHNADPQAIFNRLQRLGLNAFLVSGRGLRPVGPDHIATNAARRPGRFARINGYRPNIVFSRLNHRPEGYR